MEQLVPKFLIDSFVGACEATGLYWGPTDPSLFWYQQPWVHIVEFVVFHLFCYFCHRLAPTFFEDNVTRKVARAKPTSTIDTILGLTYMACWVFQVVLKALRPQPLIQLCWMFMPCHVITVVWVYIFLSPNNKKNYHYLVYLATLITAFHWGPTSAAMFPDWGDHQYKIEGYFFLLHHSMLVLTPVYWATRYEIIPMSFKFMAHATMVATFINVGPYTIISYITGLNLNYHLYPPPKLMNLAVFKTQAYRVYVIGILILLTILFHTITVVLSKILRLIFRIAPPQVGGKKDK